MSGFSQGKRRTDELCESRIPNWRLHDLRRTGATNMARLGISTELIGRVLNHAPERTVTGIYDRHSYLDEKRRALDTWERKLLSVIRPTSDNVVFLPGSGV